MKPGVTLEQAQAEISAVGKRLETNYPDTNRGRGFKLFPLWQTPFNNAGTLLPTLRISLVVACLVLFIACANVGNLLLVRSFARRHEMTVRLSVGAGRWRLLKQLLTEGLMLSAAAVAGGLLVAYWCRNLITLLFPPKPAAVSVIHLPAAMDWRVLALSAGVCLLATLLFGLVPAMQASKIDLAAAMKSESSGVVGGRGKAWIRSGLVLVQVSLSFVLLVGAGAAGEEPERHAGNRCRLCGQRRPDGVCRHGWSRLRRAAHAEFSRPIRRAGERAAGRAIGGLVAQRAVFAIAVLRRRPSLWMDS